MVAAKFNGAGGSEPKQAWRSSSGAEESSHPWEDAGGAVQVNREFGRVPRYPNGQCRTDQNRREVHSRATGRAAWRWRTGRSGTW